MKKNTKYILGSIIVPILIGFSSGLGSFYLANIIIVEKRFENVLKSSMDNEFRYLSLLKEKDYSNFKLEYATRINELLRHFEENIYEGSKNEVEKLIFYYKFDRELWLNLVINKFETVKFDRINYIQNAVGTLHRILDYGIVLTNEQIDILKRLLNDPYIKRHDTNRGRIERILAIQEK